MKENKIVLNSKNIMKEAKLDIRITSALSLVMMSFGFLAIFVLFTQKNYQGNKVLAFMFCSIFVIVPLISIIRKYLLVRKARNGDYVVVTDILKDKEQQEYSEMRDDGSTTRWFKYLLYFDKLFSKYNKQVEVNISVYDEAKQNDVFYLMFVGDKILAFNANKYVLDDDVASKVVDVESLSNYIDIKEYKVESKEEYVNLNKKKIIKDFSKEQRFTVFMSCIVDMFLIALTVLLYLIFENIAALAIMIIVLLGFLFFSVVKIGFVIKVKHNIRKNKYIVKKDRLVSLNKNIEFSEQHELITFKFEKYKKLFYDKKSNYVNPCENDLFYLVFVDGESDPIKVYQEKYVTLDGDLKM